MMSANHEIPKETPKALSILSAAMLVAKPNDIKVVEDKEGANFVFFIYHNQAQAECLINELEQKGFFPECNPSTGKTVNFFSDKKTCFVVLSEDTYTKVCQTPKDAFWQDEKGCVHLHFDNIKSRKPFLKG